MWSKTRLRHMTPWISEWCLEEMFAGVEGKGAQDAAYDTALITEWCELTGTDLTGGAADIYKCFDQIDRTLLHMILKEAGMPAANL